MEEKYILKEINDEYGLISVKEAESRGISRFRLSYLASEGEILRVSHGVYSLKEEIIDEYLVLQMGGAKVIFSYHTALYFHGLSDRIPSQIHITVPQGYNASRIKKNHENIVVHYVKEEVFDLGRTQITSPLGGEITIYDAERCICDLIKDRDNIDPQIVTDGIKQYFSRKKINIKELIQYARVLKVEEEVRRYIEVLR